MDQSPNTELPNATWNSLPNAPSASSTKSPKSRKKSPAPSKSTASATPTTQPESKKTKKSSRKAKPESPGLEIFGAQQPDYSQWVSGLTEGQIKELNNLLSFTAQAN